MENAEPKEHAADADVPAPEAERGAAPPAPTPVRAARAGASVTPESGETAAPRPAAPPPEATLEAEGVRWAVRVLGCSGSGAASTPLLRLGFFHPDDPGTPRREAWAVARGLDALTQLQVEGAWRAGTPPAPAGERRAFFPEIAARGTKEG